jgi:hypothetical protein
MTPPPRRIPSQRDIEEADARFRRTYRGGDDVATRIVFVVIVIALATWFTVAWINRAHTATPSPPTAAQRR